MIEEERIKKGLILEDTILKSPRKRLNKTTVLSQHRPDIRDVVNSSSIILYYLFLREKF
jgi:hypothetical protein